MKRTPSKRPATSSRPATPRRATAPTRRVTPVRPARTSRSAEPPESERPLRADAARNRARLLVAADKVLVAHGGVASTEDVAREAGVGVGTVFRHFPTKEALLTAVYLARLERLTERARGAASAADAGEAFFRFLLDTVHQSRCKRLLADSLAAAGVDVKSQAEPAVAELRAAVGVLLTRAQQARAVRRDVDVPAIMALLVAASRLSEHLADDPSRREPTLGVLFDGLRAGR